MKDQDENKFYTDKEKCTLMKKKHGKMVSE